MTRSGCPICRQQNYATPEAARTRSIALAGCSGNRFSGGRAVDAQADSASQNGRFETETLALAENRAALADPKGRWIDRFHFRYGLK